MDFICLSLITTEKLNIGLSKRYVRKVNRTSKRHTVSKNIVHEAQNSYCLLVPFVTLAMICQDRQPLANELSPHARPLIPEETGLFYLQ